MADRLPSSPRPSPAPSLWLAPGPAPNTQSDHEMVCWAEAGRLGAWGQSEGTLWLPERLPWPGGEQRQPQGWQSRLAWDGEESGGQATRDLTTYPQEGGKAARPSLGSAGKGRADEASSIPRTSKELQVSSTKHLILVLMGPGWLWKPHLQMRNGGPGRSEHLPKPQSS